MPVETPVPDILGDSFMPLFRVIDRSSYDNYLGQAVDYYGGDEFEALVLFWPDKAGKYIWDSEKLSDQSEALEICVRPLTRS